jgi:tetratricopeptide (TPR) repeat protein
MRLARTLLATGLLALGTLVAGTALGAGSGPSTRAESPRPTPSTEAEKAREADFEKAEYLIKADQCAEAIPLLKNVVDGYARDADALNYLGFCHRKTGKLKESLAYYEQALAVNPKHKGAHEYLGELYLRMGDLPKAEGQLEILKGLCPSGCEELEDLEADIEDFKANGGKLP